ncbi:hypothetical protein GGR28_000706 [Lewinella aquimaris]|uniref:Uncharacterized protein n=1 Tax=Neolewinella aquimaris TaxID=1835722 RepID=A0A840E359_9BACT|nr:hypothetical protein [Neolewinella aquimaris]
MERSELLVGGGIAAGGSFLLSRSGDRVVLAECGEDGVFGEEEEPDVLVEAGDGSLLV